MMTPCFVNLLQFASVLLLLKPSNSKIFPWNLNYSRTVYTPESLGNLREVADEFYGWDRIAELYDWEAVPDNSSGNGTDWETGADANPLKCLLRFEYSSCVNACGEFRSFYCSCDEFCLIYHSCCNDYENVCRNESEKSLARYSQFVGVPVECISLTDSYYVISGCPETSNVTLSRLCSESKAEPVSVSHTGLHFKNKFCLLCFDVSDPVEKWKISIGMNRRGKRSTESYDFRQLLRGQTTPFAPTWEFTSWYLARRCVPGAISRCPKNTPIKLKRLCEYSQHPFKLQYQANNNLELYKNEFCADCHSRFLTNVSHCSYLGAEYFQSRNPHFKILMSLESPKNIVLTTSKLGPFFSWVKINCRSMVDMEPRDCQITECQDTFELVNGQCVKKKIQFSECFLLNFLVTKQQADDLNFINDIFLITDDFLKGINFTYQNYTVDTNPLRVSGGVIIIFRYDLIRKWAPDISVFFSYVDFVEHRNKDKFDFKGELGICTNPVDYVNCMMLDCFKYSHKKTIHFEGNNETNINMARPCVACHYFLMTLFVAFVLY